jgi:hypothetical protein
MVEVRKTWLPRPFIAKMLRDAIGNDTMAKMHMKEIQNFISYTQLSPIHLEQLFFERNTHTLKEAILQTVIQEITTDGSTFFQVYRADQGQCHFCALVFKKYEQFKFYPLF